MFERKKHSGPLGFTHSLCITALVSFGLLGCQCDRGKPFETIDVGIADAEFFEAGFLESGIGSSALALVRTVPNHGPFAGENLVLLRGNGFSPSTKIFLNMNEVESGRLRFVDKHRLEIRMPPGSAGPVDVHVEQNGTRASLINGYTYDAVTLDPPNGSTAGGYRIHLLGQGTTWLESTRITMGRQTCTAVELISNIHLSCVVPPGDAGPVDVEIETQGEPIIRLADAFEYFSLSNPNSGGLGGGPLEGELLVTVIEPYSGSFLPDAFVLVGNDTSGVHRGHTDANGQIVFRGDELRGLQTVHVAKHCFEKTSFVNFDAKAVTVFLNPWLDPTCGDPGQGNNGGNTGEYGAIVSGELVFEGTHEFSPNPWNIVPQPSPGWERVAYVYATQVAADNPNPDPNPDGTRQRITESETGTLGYPYTIFVRTGGFALFAVAGLERTSDQRFFPYAMGVTRNLLFSPREEKRNINIDVNLPLDHYIEASFPRSHEGTSRGPDRFRLSAHLDLGGEGLAVKNILGRFFDQSTSLEPQPILKVPFVPPLTGTIHDASYRVEATWGSGNFLLPPQQSIYLYGIRDLDQRIVMDSFLGIPLPIVPEYGGAFPSNRNFSWTQDGRQASFHVVTFIGSNRQPAWRLFMNGNTREFFLPDFSVVEGLSDMPSGGTNWNIVSAHIQDHDFNLFSYRDLARRYWNASATQQLLVVR